MQPDSIGHPAFQIPDLQSTKHQRTEELLLCNRLTRPTCNDGYTLCINASNTFKQHTKSELELAKRAAAVSK
jgi:hypothetical protein